MPEVLAFATDDASCQFHRTTITRREPGPTEVFFEVAYAGICHSDIHTAKGEWGPTTYPLVPGHELAGIVTEVGSAVNKVQIGDRVGVGCFVDSCRACENCRAGQEQFCTGPGRTIWTYGARGRDGLP
ncbi:MAG TPA: hydroxyacid dehydrogenase, partial [Propionibacteriaceae bacterium]|nr:hydroxyacid dehydrogenase [Propionibacteriaceae bacterium]